MNQLIQYLKRYKYNTLASFILITISAITALVIPKLIQYVINDGISASGGPDIEIMHKYGLIMIGVAVLGLVCGMLNAISTARLAQNVGADMRSDGFLQVQNFSYEDIEKFKTANLVVRLTNDINQIQTVVMLLFSTLMRMPIMLVGAFYLAVTTMPQLWWVIILLIVIIVGVMMLVLKRMGPMFGKFQIQLDKINSIIKENFIGARVVKAFVSEKKEEKKFDVENQALRDLNLGVGNTMAVVMPAFMLIANLLTVLVIYLTANIAQTDVSALGSMVSYINYLSQVMMALIIGGMVTMQFSRAFVSLKRFNEIIETKPSIQYVEGNDINLKGKIEFKDVTFTYPDAVYPSLTDVSFTINPGEKVGLVGPTGAGKSTLVHLILRLFDVNNGEVLLDDKNIKLIPKQTLREDVSIVLQKPILFSGTIQENLINGSNANEKEMMKAARDAQAAEFIERLTQEYHSDVNARGSNFSGGQKQRLSIARGLIGHPPILVLDDSTSALDSKSEKAVKDALYSKYYEDETVIIIAQKISSIIEADKVIVLNDGRLVGFDTPANLLKNNKYYQEIFNSQEGQKRGAEDEN
ncbi:ABC transporter ATP-binding protein [Mycoplasma sp. P36-A1]|uniref:ABC transporter ATP-binding protein n=1 Tax=Mycoplasma sp. P36-A1 TaxID=3252900 RepID=UPI003C3065A2